MSRTAVKSKPAPKAKAKPAPQPAPKAKRKPRPAPVVVEPEPEETEVHHGLTGIATRSRSTADGSVPAKHSIFEQWLKNPVQARADAVKIAAKYDIKESTCKSWMSNWGLGLDAGGYYPASLRGREKELAVALKKLAQAKKAS